ncbi:MULTISPECIES: flagellar brake protein [Aquitalea]|uniref:Flagellar brake protein YcgR n=1 Tax=Aquitalea magnusonii TaxID=332411 RepID=A0A318J4C6_9NEIS|nr:flagellar brake protein [Aquitalea magnusonii]PXX43583.1 c-di-GMP-binding flagellar brake protein YcgR [Aquitalea magnusonii]
MSEDNTPGMLHGDHAQPDLTRYILATPVEVVHHLTSIAKSGHMVTVFSNKGKTFILTRFLEVDARQGVLLLDWGADPATNEQLLNSERNVFVCSPDGVKTQFVTGAARKVVLDSGPAFEVDLPEQVIKLQRREFFRIQTPVSNPVSCHIADYPGRPLDLVLFDISLGGCSLWLPAPHAPGFELGQKYQNCSLELKPLGSLRVGIEIRHRLTTQLRNGNEAVRAGCAFLNMTPSSETLVQRYVGQLERERRALVG